MLHLKGLFLSGDRTTIVLSSTLGITEMEKPWKADVSSVSSSSERNFNYGNDYGSFEETLKRYHNGIRAVN